MGWVPSTRGILRTRNSASRPSLAVRFAHAPAASLGKNRRRKRGLGVITDAKGAASLQRRPLVVLRLSLSKPVQYACCLLLKTRVFTTRSQRRLTFPVLEIDPGSACHHALAMGPVGRAACRFMAPHRRIRPRGPLVVDLQSAVEQVRGSEIHLLYVLLGALGSLTTITPSYGDSGYRNVTTVAVARRFFEPQLRHASCALASAQRHTGGLSTL
jgi:hypothetical protein